MTPKPKKQLKSIRISDVNANTLTELYGGVYAGANQAVEAYIHIRQHTLLEITGIFTREEWLCMIDTLNGFMQEPKHQANRRMFKMEMEDAEKYNSVSTFHEVPDYDTFLQKLDNLTSAQVYLLQDEIFRFWIDDNRNLDTFISKYAKQ